MVDEEVLEMNVQDVFKLNTLEVHWNRFTHPSTHSQRTRTTGLCLVLFCLLPGSSLNSYLGYSICNHLSFNDFHLHQTLNTYLPLGLGKQFPLQFWNDRKYGLGSFNCPTEVLNSYSSTDPSFSAFCL